MKSKTLETDLSAPPPCSTIFITDVGVGFKRTLAMTQKNGNIYLAIDVDADLVVKISPAKRKSILNLLMTAEDGELNI
jgi:hypothetical protein